MTQLLNTMTYKKKLINLFCLSVIMLTGITSLDSCGDQENEEIIDIIEEEVFTGTVDGHEWVDLGLPSHTKWATTNIGAPRPTAPGDHFAWGETTPKTEYEELNYKYFDEGSYLVYSAPYDLEDSEGLKILRDEDNAAYMFWGPSWDMPTAAQVQEIEEYCSLTDNGNFVTITGPNGRSIQCPKTGYKYSDNLICNKDKVGYLSSKELRYEYNEILNEYCWGAVTLAFSDSFSYKPRIFRGYGFAVRPVLKKAGN